MPKNLTKSEDDEFEEILDDKDIKDWDFPYMEYIWTTELKKNDFWSVTPRNFFEQIEIHRRLSGDKFEDENIENIISFMWIIDIYMLIVTCSDSIKYNLKNKKVINIILPALLILTTFLNTRYVFIILTYKLTAIILAGILILMWLINKKLIFSKR